MTFKAAASRWYQEVGQHHENEETTVTDLNWLKRHIGPNTLLHDITDSKLAELVARRRGEHKWGRKELGLVANTTVNRSVTQRLRHIILRAKNIWKVQVPDIKFTDHLLDEPQERVREASIGEEADILSQLTRGYDDAIRFAFDTGCRRMEILGMEWSHVDFFSDRFTVTGKYGKIRTLPMSETARALLWDQRSHHPSKVWTYEAQRTLKKQGIIRGQRYPQTEAGLKTAFRRATERAGVENFRFHDTRHTAATRILRESNLRIVQDILGHSDPKTTTKYAHATDDDIRRAMNAASSKMKVQK
ncbi:tyrosine-type recombinase/integrase [Hoeflea sp. TYP-13]|uniref:tyrosine-type recombinase/integrase n=1 Tax=Hoeflea sp. TYP-13 TaxID=3230023 RepID=UPI0034C5D652